MSSCDGNIPIRSGRQKRVPPWSLEQQRWAPSLDLVQFWPEKTKFAFDPQSRCGTEASRRLTDQSRVPALGQLAQPSRAARWVEKQRVASHRVSLFELVPDLELQAWTQLSPQPGAFEKFARRVRTERLLRLEKAGRRLNCKKLATSAECI